MILFTILITISILFFIIGIGALIATFIEVEPAYLLICLVMFFTSFVFSNAACDASGWKTVRSEIVEIDRTNILKLPNGIAFNLGGKTRELVDYESVDKFNKNQIVVYEQDYSPICNIWNTKTTYFKMFDQNGKLLASWNK